MNKASVIFALILVGIPLAAVAQINFADGSSQSTAGQPEFVRTIVVRPVGTNIANGTALKSAYDGASGTTPILIKLEPGVYDLGTNRIALRSGFNIQGSGVDSTTIRSSQNNISFGVLDHDQAGTVELSAFTLEHASSGGALGIFASGTSARISDVTVRFTGAATSIQGIRSPGGTLELRDCTIEMDARPGIGVFLSGTSADIRGLDVNSDRCAGGVTGITLNFGALELRDSRIRITELNTTSEVWALSAGAMADISNSEFLVTGASTMPLAGMACSSSVRVTHSKVSSQNTSGVGYGIKRLGGTVLGATSLISGSSQNVSSSGSGTVTLVHCYDGGFAAIP